LNEEHAEKVYMIREVTAIQKLEQEVRVKLARKRYTSRYTMDDILGSSEEIRLLKKLAGRIAVFDQPVYIYGESGTGKELFAQAIHHASPRAKGAFVAVNCSAFSKELLRACWKASCSATPRARSPARKGRHDRRF
jgi:transcriptional regulator with PAS, ATPase and Fis domain